MYFQSPNCVGIFTSIARTGGLTLWYREPPISVSEMAIDTAQGPNIFQLSLEFDSCSLACHHRDTSAFIDQCAKRTSCMKREGWQILYNPLPLILNIPLETMVY